MPGAQRSAVRTRSMADEKLNSDIEELKALQMQDMHELKQDIQRLLQGQSSMQQLINSLVQSNKKKDEEIKRLGQRVDELEQYTRRDDVIVNGLKTKPRTFASVASSNPDEKAENTPQHEQESIEDQVISFLRDKDIELSPAEISACHPLPIKDKTKPQPIVIRFVSRKTKQRLMSNAKKLKGTSVFINEHLTSKNANIAREARAMVKDRTLNSCWTRNGYVFIKRAERGGTMKVEVIKDVEDLRKLKRQ